MLVKCSQVASLLVDTARGIDLAPRRRELLDAHLRDCPRCAQRLERERAVSESLRQLAEEMSVPAWNAASEAVLLDAFDAAQMHRRPSRRWYMYATAAAALLALASVALVRHREPALTSAVARTSAPVAALGSTTNSSTTHAIAAAHDVGRQSRPRPATSAKASAPRRGTAFLVWPGATDLPAFESGQLVRVELPASVAVSLGLAPSTRARVVNADVLIGQDGFARAVRLAP
jgi:hypothetical protein